MKSRNINLDLIRCLAIFCVISIHFLLNTGFYFIKMNSFLAYVLLFFRTFFMICVPLFILLTGYLMNQKKLSKKYYLGIVKVLFIFVCAKVVYLLVDGFYFHEIESFLIFLQHIFSYSSTVYNDYSWYVNMYIGLFLLIPFLNLIYNNLENKKQKQILIITLFFLTSISTLNIKQIMFFPDWWGYVLYPLTYYFMGAYIKEFGFKLKTKYSLLILFLTNLVSSLCFFWVCYNKVFEWRAYSDYRGPGTFIISICIFGILLNLDLSKLSQKLKGMVIKVSELSFGMYLFSFIVDKVLYPKFNSMVPNVMDRPIYYFLIVPIVFLLSLILSLIFNTIYNKFIQPKIKKLSNKD